jgi:large subunit ribosomal protein L17
VPKLFALRDRYLERAGGYTRVLRTEPRKEDQAASAILELVDGPKDTRFAMTAMALARQQSKGAAITDILAQNIAKVTRYRKDGKEELERMVRQFETLRAAGDYGVDEVQKKKVYPTGKQPKSKDRYADEEDD